MHILKFPSLFLMNKTCALQGDTLGRIYPLSSNSYNCILHFVNSGILIWYGARDTGVENDIRSMVKSKYHLGGNTDILSRNTTSNSFKIGNCSNSIFYFSGSNSLILIP